jgi:outer membrane protein assembly factor BamA
VFDRATGQYLGDDRQDLDAPEALNLIESTAALVYDQTVFGPTSPIVGQRYRMEVAPTFGALNITNVTVDYRRYLAPIRPLTLAVRAMHLGRYGRDSSDTRLSPLFLGFPTLMRGYELGSFERSECPAAADDCPVFDQLVGSRSLIGNLELRFPLLGLLSREYRYGPLPIEGFAFADTGVAWTADLDPSFAGGNRNFVSSVGGGIRVNAFGYAVVSLTAARPLDRPGRGWVFGFQLAPGF